MITWWWLCTRSACLISVIQTFLLLYLFLRYSTLATLANSRLRPTHSIDMPSNATVNAVPESHPEQHETCSGVQFIRKSHALLNAVTINSFTPSPIRIARRINLSS
ncbi:hypothetical protein F4782DRAFT_515188 [Xylaria castorea]|nr:hypothetical protein F4782DRAFT_515188 [Xylaria castorea]